MERSLPPVGVGARVDEVTRKGAVIGLLVVGVVVVALLVVVLPLVAIEVAHGVCIDVVVVSGLGGLSRVNIDELVKNGKDQIST